MFQNGHGGFSALCSSRHVVGTVLAHVAAARRNPRVSKFGLGFGFRVRFRVWAKVPRWVWSSGSGFGSGFGSRVRSGVQVRASVQGSGPKFGLEISFGGFRCRVQSGVQVQGSVQGSGPEFSLEFRFGVRFRVRVGAPSSVLSSGSEFGSGFCGVRNAKPYKP